MLSFFKILEWPDCIQIKQKTLYMKIITSILMLRIHLEWPDQAAYMSIKVNKIIKNIQTL